MRSARRRMARLFAPDTGRAGGPDDSGQATRPPTGTSAKEAPARATPRWRDRRGRWRRGWVVAGLALLLALVLLLHSRVPNGVGSLGSLLQTFLPWLGLVIPVLAGCAVLRRSVTATL